MNWDIELFGQRIAQRKEQQIGRQGVRGRRRVVAVGGEHQLGHCPEFGSQ
ncbi:Uncharacterised protein [Mycobacterium tuberculosis]|nr:Uncharacterised protein [Mycobacterium tuberculosis]